MASDEAEGTLATLGIPREDILAVMYRRGVRGRERFYEVLASDLRKALRNLEDVRDRYRTSSEDTITSTVVIALRQVGYCATQDTYSAGHPDIVVDSSALDLKWLAETKIHKDYQYAIDGLKQLVTRYSSGRDPSGGFLLYTRVADAADVCKNLRAAITADNALQLRRFEDGDHFTRFRSVHLHPTGTEYAVDHHIVLMHHQPQDKSGRKTAANRGVKS